MLRTPAPEGKLLSSGMRGGEGERFGSSQKNNYRQFLAAEEYLDSFDSHNHLRVRAAPISPQNLLVNASTAPLSQQSRKEASAHNVK